MKWRRNKLEKVEKINVYTSLTLSLLLRALFFKKLTISFQPLEEPMSPPKFHTKSPKVKPKKSEDSISNSLAELPFDTTKSAKIRKAARMDKALVQLEKLTFPLQVLFWHVMLQKQNLNLLYIFYQLVMLVHSLML